MEALESEMSFFALLKFLYISELYLMRPSNVIGVRLVV